MTVLAFLTYRSRSTCVKRIISAKTFQGFLSYVCLECSIELKKIAVGATKPETETVCEQGRGATLGQVDLLNQQEIFTHLGYLAGLQVLEKL